MCENVRVYSCVFVFLFGSLGIEWVFNKYKCDLRISRVLRERRGVEGFC